VMIGVHNMTNGKMCDTGCHAFRDGECYAYKKLTHSVEQLLAVKSIAIKPQETVKQEAKRRGISISEVRRQRQKRKNNEGIKNG